MCPLFMALLFEADQVPAVTQSSLTKLYCNQVNQHFDMDAMHWSHQVVTALKLSSTAHSHSGIDNSRKIYLK